MLFRFCVGHGLHRSEQFGKSIPRRARLRALAAEKRPAVSGASLFNGLAPCCFRHALLPTRGGFYV